MCCLQEYLQILITFRQQLVLNFSSIAPASASFIIFRSRLSQSFPAMDETRISGQLCLLQWIHFSSGRQTQSSLKISCSPLSQSLASGPKKKQHVSTCLLQSFIISLAWWRWSRFGATWLRLHDHLRCKITGLTPRDGLNAPLPLFLLCRPLRCLTFTADSIITAVWEGIKRDVACSFSHLLNIQLHYTGQSERRRRQLDSRYPLSVKFCQNS